MRTFELLASLGLLVLAVSACSSSSVAPKEAEKCKLQVLSGAIIASPHINPTVEGEPRPVQLRLYQLKDDSGFLNATFEQIWQDDKAALGSALVKSEELTVYPNSRVSYKFERDDSAQFLTAAALFREPKGRTWFTSFELPPPPSAGACGAQCVGPECEASAKKDYRIYIWLDGMVVQDGSEHADVFPEGRVVDKNGKPSSEEVGAACKGAAEAAGNAATSAISPPNAQLPSVEAPSVEAPSVQPPSVPVK